MANDEKNLFDIISTLSVPKNRHNEFGGFDYRSAEDITTVLKPKLIAAGMLPHCTHRVEERGGHVYQVATVCILRSDLTVVGRDGHLESEGWAREDITRKKMDAPQLSGSAASYAEKRAWGNYLGLNDEQDADALNVGNGKPDVVGKEYIIDHKTTPPVVNGMTSGQSKALHKMLTDTGMIHLKPMFKYFLSKKGMLFGDSINDLTKEQASQVIQQYYTLICLMCANTDMHPLLLTEFKKIDAKEHRVAVIKGMHDLIDENSRSPIPDYNQSTPDALVSYCQLFLTTIHHQEANRITQDAIAQGVSVEDALEIFTVNGLKPRIVNQTNLEKEDSEKKTGTVEVDTSFI